MGFTIKKSQNGYLATILNRDTFDTDVLEARTIKQLQLEIRLYHIQHKTSYVAQIERDWRNRFGAIND